MTTFRQIITLLLPLFARTRACRIPLQQYSLTAESALETVNAVLVSFRGMLTKEYPKMTLSEHNDASLSVLSSAGYFENDLLSMADAAKVGKHYAYLQSLYPATMAWWSSKSEVVLLMAKAYGRKKWMSMDDWTENSKAIDWELNFRALIRSNNGKIFNNEHLTRCIFENPIFWDNFVDIIREAYESDHVDFLKNVPIPEGQISRHSAFYYWSHSYKRSWGSERWNKFMTEELASGGSEDIDVYEGDNPAIFGFDPIAQLLDIKFLQEPDDPITQLLGIKSLQEDAFKKAIVRNSVSYAEYLVERCGIEEFQECVNSNFRTFKNVFLNTTISKLQIRNSILKHFHKSETMSSSRRWWFTLTFLSQTSNVLLNHGGALHPDKIGFCDIIVLDKNNFQKLLDHGFKKAPKGVFDVAFLGTTETGIEFLKMILRGKYFIDTNTPLKLSYKMISKVRLFILDIEAFHLIDAALKDMDLKDGRRGKFRAHCAMIATELGDVKFLQKAGIIPHPLDIFAAAEKGNIAVLDWVLENDPSYLRNFSLKAINTSYCQSRFIPLLQHLHKKSLPCDFINQYTIEHLNQAIIRDDAHSHTRILATEGILLTLFQAGVTIPLFPEREVETMEIDVD